MNCDSKNQHSLIQFTLSFAGVVLVYNLFNCEMKSMIKLSLSA